MSSAQTTSLNLFLGGKPPSAPGPASDPCAESNPEMLAREIAELQIQIEALTRQDDEMVFEMKLIARQNARLKENLARERRRLKNERKRGDEFFKKTIRLEAGMRHALTVIEQLVAENEQLRDKNDQVENEVLDAEERFEELCQRERDRRRRTMGHNGVIGRCCPYSGRRSRRRGQGDAHEDEEDHNECFMCCPCCAFSSCATECGPDCRIKEHRQDDGDEDASTATTRSSSRADGDWNIIDEDGNDLGVDSDDPDDGHRENQPQDEDETLSGDPKLDLDDSRDNNEFDPRFLEGKMDDIYDNDNENEVEETRHYQIKKNDDNDGGGWSDDITFWRESNENYFKNRGNGMEEFLPQTEEEGGYDWIGDVTLCQEGSDVHDQSGTEMTELADDLDQREAAANIAPSHLPPSHFFPCGAPHVLHIPYTPPARLFLNATAPSHPHRPCPEDQEPKPHNNENKKYRTLTNKINKPHGQGLVNIFR